MCHFDAKQGEYSLAFIIRSGKYEKARRGFYAGGGSNLEITESFSFYRGGISNVNRQAASFDYGLSGVAGLAEGCTTGSNGNDGVGVGVTGV